jgi:N-acetyl-anhydromuramyl-L-alanine amidase AmpD
MAVYDESDGTKWLTDAANVRVGKNGTVQRVVVHTTAGGTSNQNQADAAYATWTDPAQRAAMGVAFISAHFVVELDGRVIQMVDTNDIAFGTGWLTDGSVHIEFAGDHPYPLTNDQFYYGAKLISWIAREHTDVVLETTGTSIADPGRPQDPGITCHKFIQEVWRKDPANAGKAFTAKACPGAGVIAQLGDLARQAKLFREIAIP